jgi:hypothetical protein
LTITVDNWKILIEFNPSSPKFKLPKHFPKINGRKKQATLLLSIFILSVLSFITMNAQTPEIYAHPAAPVWQASSAIGASTGVDVTVTLPAHLANDIFLLQVLVKDVDDTITVSGWTQLATVDRDTVSRYWWFWKRATSSAETNPLVGKSTATGNTYAAVTSYRGATTTGDPFEVKGTPNTATTPAHALNGITTLTADSLIIASLSGEDDSAESVSYTATNPSTLTSRLYVESSTGTDGVCASGSDARSSIGATGTVNATWNDDVIGSGGIVLALKPPTAPENGAASITDMDDSNNLYAQKKYYTFQQIATDADSYADIHYMRLRIKQGATTRAEFEYHEDDNTFSKVSGASWDISTGTSSATRSGTQITASYKIAALWNAVEESGVDIEVYVEDAAAASDTDTAQTDYFDVVTRLVTLSFTITNSLDVGGTITATGNVRYANNPASNTESSSYPPDAEFTSVIIHDASHNVMATDITISNGAFNPTFTQPVGTTFTYHVYLNMADAEYTDADAPDGDTITQYKVTITSSGIAGDSSGTVATLNAQAKTQAQLPYDRWCIASYSLAYSFSSPVSTSDSNKRYAWSSTSGLSQTLQTNTFAVSAAGTITGTYGIQWQVTYTSSGISTDTSTNTVVTVDSVAKQKSQLPFSTWYNNGANSVYAFSSPVSTTDGDKRYPWSSTSGLSQTLQSNTFAVTAGGTVTGTYTIQWQVTITSSGIAGDSSGTVATLDGDAKTQAQIPYSKWLADSYSLTFSFTSPVSAGSTKRYVWSSTSGLSQTLQTNTFSVTSGGTITGTYGTQYLVTITTSGISTDSSGTVATLGGNAKTQAQLPYTDWFPTGNLAYAFSSPVSTTDSNKRYPWSSTSGMSQTLQSNTFSLSSSGTITGTYSIEYQVIFASSGIGSDTSTNTVVTVASVAKKQSDLPFGSWVASGDTISYTFAFPVSTTDSNKRYGLTSVSGLSQTLSSNTITVSAGGTVTGTYLSAWQIAVTSSGISTDTSGTVVTLSGNAKTQSQLPYYLWFNNSASVVFSFTSPVSATAGKQYVWSSTSGLSQTLQSNTFSASSGGTITGTYTIQYQVTITSSGIGGDSTGTVATLDGDAKTQAQLPYSKWLNSGYSLTYAFSSPVSAGGLKQYVWLSTSGLSQTLQSNSFTVSTYGTLTGTYATAALHHFTFNTISSPQTAGVAFSITITAKDAYENTVTSYIGTNSLTDSTGTISPVTTGGFSSGTWTGSVTITKAQTGVTITTIGGGKSGTSGSFNVNPAAASKLVIIIFPSSAPDYSWTSVYVVERQDQYGNQVTSGSTTVNLASDSTGAGKKFADTPAGSTVTSVVIPVGSGTKDFYYYDDKTGLWTISVSAAGLTGDSKPLRVFAVQTVTLTSTSILSVTTTATAAPTTSTITGIEQVTTTATVTTSTSFTTTATVAGPTTASVTLTSVSISTATLTASASFTTTATVTTEKGVSLTDIVTELVLLVTGPVAAALIRAARRRRLAPIVT